MFKYVVYHFRYAYPKGVPSGTKTRRDTADE